MNHQYQFLGQGIYTVSEAAVLSGIAASKISRWVRGYGSSHNRDANRMPAVFDREYPEIDGKTALSFLDLIEVRFVDWFRHHGVSWKSIRIAAERASYMLDTGHPFAKRQFFTDGKTILARISMDTGDTDLIDLVKQQYEMDRLVSPVLYGNLDFDTSGFAERWWPRGRDGGIVIDPTLSFGQPVVEKFGVPTKILADAFQTVKSEREVADWYEVDVNSVKSALEFEQALLAA